ncbi:MAG TPA: hypothetical protein VF411_05980 [Bacteroidia bacterium]
MHRNLFYFVGFGILLFVSACTPTVSLRSAYQTKLVTADGNPQEWRIPLRFYDSDTKLNYTLTNDDEKIYLCVRIVDELSQAKVVRNGMNIWFDTLAKKNKQCGILFPVPDKNADEYQQESNSGSSSKKKQEGNLDGIKRKFLQQANQMQLTGFKSGIPDFLAASTNEYGINVSINWDVNNIMIYEAVIPFKTFYKDKLVAKDSLKNIDFSMTIPGFPAPEKKDDGSGNASGGVPGGGAGGGMGGMGGNSGMGGRGGMGGGMNSAAGGANARGMRGGNAVEVNPMYVTNSFWVKIRLAAK